jgi:hypothetical protein
MKDEWHSTAPRVPMGQFIYMKSVAKGKRLEKAHFLDEVTVTVDITIWPLVSGVITIRFAVKFFIP